MSRYEEIKQKLASLGLTISEAREKGTLVQFINATPRNDGNQLSSSGENESSSSHKEMLLLQELLAKVHNKAPLLSLYNKWFYHLIGQFPQYFQKNGIAEAIDPKGKITKDYLIEVIFTVYTEKDVFEIFWEGLPQDIQSVFSFLVWQRDPCKSQQLEQMFDIEIIKEGEHYNANEALRSKFSFFQISHQHSYYYYSDASSAYEISFSPVIQKHLRKFFDPPREYDLHPVKILESAPLLYENKGAVLEEMPLFSTYIEEGHLKLSKGGKPLKSSIKELSRFNISGEFYPKEKGLESMRVELMTSFLLSEEIKPTLEPLKDLQALFEKYEEDCNFSNLEGLQFHLKGRNAFHNHYHRSEKNIEPTFWNQLMKALPLDEWVSFSNLLQYSILRDLPLENVNRSDSYQYLYTVQTMDSHNWKTEEKVYVSASSYDEMVLSPLLAGSFFLMASFGLLDLSYTLPKNENYPQKGKDYLSIFEGLRYVRLSELGAYITGRTNEYVSQQQEKEKITFVLEERRLLFSMKGNDHLKQIVIEKLAVPIAGKRYKMDYESFLKGCLKKSDVKKKIEMFKAHVDPSPPPLWEEFFKDALSRINPLSLKSEFQVFQLEDNRELISIMAKDEILKKYILKAEQFHVVISKKDFPKVKKRLESLGYLITA